MTTQSVRLVATGEVRRQRQVRKSEDGRWLVTPHYMGWSRSGVSRANCYQVTDGHRVCATQYITRFSDVLPAIETALRKQES